MMKQFDVSLLRLAVTAAAFTLCSALAAQDFGGKRDGDLFERPSFSPYAGRNFPTQVYWGDTHLHTTLSFDAGSFGNRLGPEEAYRFARGEQVTSTTGNSPLLGSIPNTTTRRLSLAAFIAKRG